MLWKGGLVNVFVRCWCGGAPVTFEPERYNNKAAPQPSGPPSLKAPGGGAFRSSLRPQKLRLQERFWLVNALQIFKRVELFIGAA